MSVKKGNRFSNDLWCIKYQRDKNWNDLLQKIEFERNSKEQRIQTELGQANKIHNFIIGQSSKSKLMDWKQKRVNRKMNKKEED